MKPLPHRRLASLIGAVFLAGAGILPADTPPNDLRAQAVPLILEQPVAGTTAGATVEEDEPLPEEGYLNTVWYVWTAEGPGPWEARVSYSSGYASLTVYAEEGGALEEVAGGSFFRPEPDGETIYSRAARFHTATGRQLWFQVYSSGTQEFSLELRPLTDTPAEDAFAQSALLPAEVTAHPIPTTSATLEPGEPPANLRYGSVWRRWIAPSAGFWLMKFEGGVGAGVDAWRGTTLADLTSAVVGHANAFPADDGDPLPARRAAAVQAAAGETLYVRVLSIDDTPAALTIKPATPGDMFDEPVDLGSGESAGHTRLLTDMVTVERGEGSFHTGSQWFAWVCPEEAIYEIEASAPKPSLGSGMIMGMDPVVELHRGDTLATLTRVPAIPLGIVDQPLRFRAQPGERFVIRTGLTPYSGIIGPTDNGGGAFSIGPTSITLHLRKLGPPPAHDDFAAAGDLGSALDHLVTGDNTGAGDEPGEPRGAYRAGDSVWHRWTAPAAGRYEYLGESPAYLVPQIFRGAALDGLTLVTSSNNGFNDPPGHARMRFDAAAGETFHIRLAGRGYGHQGAYSFLLRRLHPPANDMLAGAIALTGDLPLQTTGDTTDAGVEAPLESSYGNSSSIWWTWTAPDSDWFELKANAQLGVLENGNRYGYTLAASDGLFRFQATAGRVYHFRLARHIEAEGPVTLTLDRLSGMAHATAQTALEADAALRFSTPLVPVAAGGFFTPAGSGSGALWLRWTPPASGWVSLDTGGSQGGVGLTAFAAGNLTQSLAVSSPLNPGLVLTGPGERAAAWMRPLEDPHLRRDLSLAGETQRILLPIAAGQTYYIRAAPDGRLSLPLVALNARPAGPPPALHTAHTRLRHANGASWLETTISVSSPNGFVEGTLQPLTHSASAVRFYDAHRTSGDAFAGEYRVALPAPQAEAPYPFQLRVQIRDAAGGAITIQTPSQEIQAPPESIPLDKQPPQLDGVIASPPHIALDGEDATVTLHLGISDAGGSGFAEGEIFLSSAADAALPPHILTLPPPVTAPPLQIARFGPAQRLRGDGDLGVYEVTLTIPAATPGGSVLQCLLRDTVGNAAGRSEYLNRLTPVFNPVHDIPLVIEQLRPQDLDPPHIHDATAEYFPTSGTHGEILLRARLTDTGSGIAGGRVLLADEHGLIAAAHTFDASALTGGTTADGSYAIRIPVPAYGFGGPHRLRWEAHDSAGNPATPALLAPLTLPDRNTGDQRRPRLSHLQISPSSVDLLAGPATIRLDLAVNDDRPGTTARAFVLDSHGRELAAGSFLCLTTSTDCEIDLSLPQVPTTGPSTAARIVIELTDAAGRRETYGPPGAAPWPDASAAALRLAPAVPGTFTRWSAAWPGLAGLPADDSRDTDGDSRPDLLEFALGTDPTRRDTGDPFAGRAPRLALSGPFQFSGSGISLQRLASWSFQPAPWFIHDTGRHLADGWEFFAESSSDLLHWETLPAPPGGGDPADRVTIHHWLPASEPSHWYRLNIRRADSGDHGP